MTIVPRLFFLGYRRKRGESSKGDPKQTRLGIKAGAEGTREAQDVDPWVRQYVAVWLLYGRHTE